MTKVAAAALVFAGILLAGCGREGMNEYGSGNYIPPDTVIGASPNYVVELVNVLMGIYNRNTGDATTSPLLSDFFLHSACANQPRLTDPRIRFDLITHHWFILIAVGNHMQGGSEVNGGWCLSVSPVENPLDTTSAWYRYFIPIGPPTYGAFQYSDGKTRKSFPDYPNFTVGSDKVILTGFPANWNAGPTNQSGSSVIVLATSQLVNQQPLVYSRFDPPPGQGYSYILQPAHEPFVEYPVGELSVFGFGTASECSNVRRYRITGPASGPTVTMTSLYDTCASFPHPASQQGTTRPIGGGDTRLLDATVTVNPTIVYLVSNSACIPTGDSAIRSCARVSQWPLVGNSVLHWLFGVPGKDVYFPAIAGDVDGNLLMVFNQSQTNEYPSVYATGRRPTDAPYQVRAPTLLHTGEGPFDVQDPTSPIPLARWGDYSGAHVDPANGAHDIFVAAEFAKANGTEWSTWGHFLLHNNYPQ